MPVAAERYADELLEEKNAGREVHGKKPFDDDSKPPKSKNQQKKNTQGVILRTEAWQQLRVGSGLNLLP